MNQRITQIIVGAAIAVFLLSNSVYVVKQWETAIRLQFGVVQENNIGPGLHFKVPFINTIRKFDRRLQTLETDPEPFLTLEKKNLIVDTFVQWRVADPKVFYERVQGNALRLNSLLKPVVQDNYRAEFANRNLQEVVAGFDTTEDRTVRAVIQNDILKNIRETGKQYGIDIVDMRIKGVELPEDVKQSVYDRMNTERERAAKEFRARGEATYIEKVANADKEREIRLADAYKKAEILRGEGDATATDIYAKAFSANPEFYEFNRSLEVYQKGIKKDGDILILDTNSEFFQYFQPK